MRDFEQMNSLAAKFGDSLTILGFPCNQFGHQTQEKDFELLDVLKYVRPGAGFEPAFPIFTKCDVNGEGEHEVFTFMKKALPYPIDDVAGTGSDMITAKISNVIWTPLKRSDIIWNFEKFLINQNGVPVRRYSPKFPTEDCTADIEKLIKDGPDALAEY